MNILDFSTTHTQETDEIINVSDSNPIHLAHDIFYNKAGKLVTIFTGAGETGDELSEGTDFDVNGVFPDGSLPESISPDVAYTTIEITNDEYHDTDLYVNYYPIGDVISAARWNVATLPAGMIAPFGMTSAPDGWLECDGSAVSRATYAALFDAVGTTWGSGDGSTTFNVPDLRGAFVRGTGSHGSETMADGNAFAGPSVGSFEDDQMQGHWHEELYRDIENEELRGYADSGANPGLHRSSAGDDFPRSLYVRNAISDGTNGTPRTGDENRPFNAGVLYCIKT